MGAIKEPTVNLYEADFYAWVQEQVAALKRGDDKRLDLVNLIEEVESLGRSEEREMESRIELLLMHLLKLQYQPSKRSRSWAATITEQRVRLKRLFKRMPSLRARLDKFLQEDYEDACVMAAHETGLDPATFPLECPYPVELLLDVDWLPNRTQETRTFDGS